MAWGSNAKASTWLMRTPWISSLNCRLSKLLCSQGWVKTHCRHDGLFEWTHQRYLLKRRWWSAHLWTGQYNCEAWLHLAQILVNFGVGVLGNSSLTTKPTKTSQKSSSVKLYCDGQSPFQIRVIPATVNPESWGGIYTITLVETKLMHRCISCMVLVFVCSVSTRKWWVWLCWIHFMCCWCCSMNSFSQAANQPLSIF